jgi:hypothetical protein
MAIKEVIYTAVIIESERGWGRKIDEVKEFQTEQERDDFIREYNKRLEPRGPQGQVPDWYMMAEPGRDWIRDVVPEKETTDENGTITD